MSHAQYKAPYKCPAVCLLTLSVLLETQLFHKSSHCFDRTDFTDRLGREPDVFALRIFMAALRSRCGHQPNFAALNRRRHLYSAWLPSRWALAHILVAFSFLVISPIGRPTVDEAGLCYLSAFERTIMYRVVSYLPALPIRDFLRFLWAL